MPTSKANSAVGVPWTLAQLQQYIQIRTGDNRVRVTHGEQPSTHMPTSNVMLSARDQHVGSSASHEAMHISETDGRAMEQLHTPAEQVILNVLEDARIERKGARALPGLRVQWQETIDLLWESALKAEPGVIQAVKVVYLACGGYRFPREDLKPDARKVLERLERSGLIPQVRKAENTMELLPLVPQVLKLFEFEPRAPQRRPGQTPQPQQGGDGEGKGNGGEGKEGKGITGKAKVGGDDDEEGDGEGEQQGQPTGGQTAGGQNRKAKTYDATDSANRSEVAKRMGEQQNGQHNSKGTVDGFDRVKGGPSVNRLVEQGQQAARRLGALDRKQRQLYDDRLAEDDARWGMSTPPQPATPQKGSGAALPDSMADKITQYDNDDAVFGSTDVSALFEGSPFSKGGTGYTDLTRYHVEDQRQPRQKSAGRVAVNVSNQLGAITNYLSKQIAVFMQSKGRDKPRSYERSGRIDPKRLSALAVGRLDIFRQRAAPSDKRPCVLLTTDISGSMGGGSVANVNSAAYHAMAATLLMGDALNALNIPFECHTFGSYGGLIKPFMRPWNDEAREAVSNIAVMGGGGTQATHALALAWARILTRPEARKIIIQVTDGGVPEDTLTMGRYIASKGTIVIGVGIGMRGVMDRYYDHHTEVDSPSELPAAFAGLLRELLPSGEWR